MQERIAAYLSKHPAKRLLWLGAEGESPELANTEVIALQLSDVDNGSQQLGNERFDCAVLQDLPGPLSKTQAESLVAQLRDVNAGRILWLLQAESPWERQELLALGFRHLDQTDDSAALYGFDIDNYKQTPDWLNPKNWANPEQWDKQRW